MYGPGAGSGVEESGRGMVKEEASLSAVNINQR